MNRSRFYYVDDPSVAIGDDGDTAVAWVDNRAQNVFLQRFDADGVPLLDTPIDVSRSPGTFSWLSKVVMSPGGDEVFVLWQEIVFSGGSHGGEAFFSRSTDGGRTFSGPVNLSRSLAGDGKGRLTRERWHNGSLDLALGPGDRLYTAWTEYEGALWFRRSTDGGGHFEPAVRIAGSDAMPARGPDLGVGPDGTIYVVWAVGEDAAADIRISVSTDHGRSFSAPRSLFPSDGHSDAPQVAVDADGVAHVVYAESPSGMFGRYHLRYARLSPGAGGPQASRRLVESRATGAQSAHYPSLAVAGGNMYIVWERFTAGERRPRGLGFTVSLDGGRSFSAPEIVPGTAGGGLGSNGGLQGLLMRKIVANDAGELAVVNSRFRRGEASRVRLIRGRVAVGQTRVSAPGS